MEYLHVVPISKGFRNGVTSSEAPSSPPRQSGESHAAATSPAVQPERVVAQTEAASLVTGTQQATSSTGIQERVQKANQLIKERQEQKALEDEENARMAEMKRRQEGQDFQKAQERVKETEALRNAYDQKKAKKEDKEHLKKFREQIAADRFVEFYDPTIEDTYRKQAIINGKTVTVDIVDTAGQELYSDMREQHYRTGDGFLLVFAVNESKSFDNVIAYIDQIIQLKGTDEVPIVLAANKCDLPQRAVDMQVARDVAKTYGFPFFETSAKMRTGIDDAFQSLAHETRKHKHKIARGGTRTGRRRGKKCAIL